MAETSGGTKALYRGGVSFAALTALVGGDMSASAAIDEMLVTARKRSESLQDVPLSVQAFSTKDLDKQDILGLADYANKIPSLTYSAWQPGAAIIVFRGATTSAEGFSGSSSAALYLDEMPITNATQSPEVYLVDIERLEAVSGPQPTTYGASSQSGTLKIVTQKPILDEFGGFVDVSLSAMEEGESSYDFNGALNIPIVEDKFAIRIVGYQANEGGYIDNVLGSSAQSHPFFTPGDFPTIDGFGMTRVTKDNASVAEDDVGDIETTGVRLSAKLALNDNWDITGMVMHQDINVDGGLSFEPSVGDLQQIRFNKESRDDKWYLATVTIEGDLGFADFTAATGYKERDIEYNMDASSYNQSFGLTGVYFATYGSVYYFSYFSIMDAAPGGGTTLTDITSFSTLDQKDERFSQELRLTSKEGESRLQWMIGAFYEKFESEADFSSFTDGTSSSYAAIRAYDVYGITLTSDPTETYYSFAGEKVEEWAVFGELGFDVTDQFNILVGARYFDYEQESRYLNSVLDRTMPQSCVPGPSLPGSCALDASGNPLVPTDTSSGNGISTLLTLTYEFNDDVLMYATRSEGFRIGGSNLLRPASTAPRQYKDDKVTNLELGLKSTFLDGRLVLNTAIYQMVWDEMQLNVADPTVPFGYNPIVINAGEAELKGVEGNFIFQVTDNFTLSGSAAYTDAQATETVILNPTTDPVLLITDGDELPLSPDWKFSLGAEYAFQVPRFDSDGYVRFDYTYVGEQLNATQGSLLLTGGDLTRLARAVTQPEYDIGNIKIGMENESWGVSLALSNIWDERGTLFQQPRFPDGRIFTNRPREITLNFRKNF